MAMRSVLRKVPRLGTCLRSPTGRPVPALSPAAGSRLISTNLPGTAGGEEVVYSKEKLAEQWKSMSLKNAENRKYFQEEYKKYTEICHQLMLSNIEARRENDELQKQIIEKLNKVGKAWGIAACLSWSMLFILVTMHITL